MATGETNRSKAATFGAAMGLAAAIALAGCSVQRPGAAQDHSLDSVERNRAAMGVALEDTSYDTVERNRLTFSSPLDTSYDDVERLRAGGTGH